MQDIKWTVAGGLVFYNEIINYLEETKSFYGLNKHLIESVFDCPQGLVWHGGREIKSIRNSLDEYIKMIKGYNDRGIGFYFTFSNTLLKERHLEDELCNYILSNTENEMNGVIISSDLLRSYIKEKFPRFNIKSSITMVSRDYNKLMKDYDIVVLQPDNNRKYEFLKEIKKPERLEVLVNEACVLNCPFRKQHYDKISQEHLDKVLIEKHTEYKCIAENNGYKRKGELVLNNDEIKRLYDLGIKNFKIQGRDGHPDGIISEMKRFIEKPFNDYKKITKFDQLEKKREEKHRTYILFNYIEIEFEKYKNYGGDSKYLLNLIKEFLNSQEIEREQKGEIYIKLGIICLNQGFKDVAIKYVKTGLELKKRNYEKVKDSDIESILGIIVNKFYLNNI